MVPFKNSEDFDRWIVGLVKAGLKEDPSDYYKVHKENKMTGEEIWKLVGGKTITGYAFGYKWSEKIYKNGESEIDALSRIHKGKAWIEGDALCRRYETLYDGLENCADIYKNPGGNNKTLNEYLLLSDYWLHPVSIEE